MNKNEMKDFMDLVKETREDHASQDAMVIQECFMELQWDLNETIAQLKAVLALEDPKGESGMPEMEGLEKVRLYYTEQVNRCEAMSKSLTALYDEDFGRFASAEERNAFCDALLEAREYLDRLLLYLDQENAFVFAVVETEEKGVTGAPKSACVAKMWKEFVALDDKYSPETIRMGMLSIVMDDKMTDWLRAYLRTKFFSRNMQTRGIRDEKPYDPWEQLTGIRSDRCIGGRNHV